LARIPTRAEKINRIITDLKALLLDEAKTEAKGLSTDQKLDLLQYRLTESKATIESQKKLDRCFLIPVFTNNPNFY